MGLNLNLNLDLGVVNGERVREGERGGQREGEVTVRFGGKFI